MSSYFLGIDTSNYTTSVSLVDADGNVVFDERKLLEVKSGERGLRQQEAVFQHISELPCLFHEIAAGITADEIKAVSVSERPRPVEGSYMPCFMAGVSFAKVIADTLDVPLYKFSHQEGHVRAALTGSGLSQDDSFICYHLSGGTMEAVKVPGYEIVSKTLDISYGQLIDRVGVRLGLSFPCGSRMDELASCFDSDGSSGYKVSIDDEGNINLSGLETRIMREIEGGEPDAGKISYDILSCVAGSLIEISEKLRDKLGVESFLFAGGVSSSVLIRRELNESGMSEHFFFGDPELSTDNAVGTALLGRDEFCR